MPPIFFDTIIIPQFFLQDTCNLLANYLHIKKRETTIRSLSNSHNYYLTSMIFIALVAPVPCGYPATKIINSPGLTPCSLAIARANSHSLV